VFHVLLALSEGEKHGWAIMRDAERLSDGVVRMGPGTLYGSLRRLLDAGLIEESGERPDPDLDDERRRYYRLTAAGADAVAAEATRLARLVRAARTRRVLQPRSAT
jgi:DNA-binding PadR family transcriptional regulator